MNTPENQKAGPEIQIKSLFKEYEMGSGQVRALDDVTATLPGGRFCVFAGPSGSGKSTLLHVLGALDHATSGSVLVGDRDLEQMDDQERNEFRKKSVGFVFQTFNLIDNLTALENVLIPFIPDGRSHKMIDRAKNILDDIGLGDRLDHRPGRLSGGEKQRVALARAVLKNPSLVLADEPTGELDTQTGTEIFRLLRRIRRKRETTVVVVTHDTNYIQDSDLVFQLQDGRIVGTPDSANVQETASNPNPE